jgi:hypothetical protein
VANRESSIASTTPGLNVQSVICRGPLFVANVKMNLSVAKLLSPMTPYRTSGLLRLRVRDLAKEAKQEALLLVPFTCQQVGLRKPTTSMTGCQGGSFSPKLCRSWHFTVIRDQLQDYGFSSTFVQLHDLPTSFVGLQECGLPDIFLQIVERKHRVLAGI